MTSCCLRANCKDTRATLVNALRDSSDVTTLLRQQGVRNHYRTLQAKGLTLPGAIPANDLYDMAHLTGKTGPASSLISGVSISQQACVCCTYQFPFNLGRSASLVRSG
jgi:hypothetical protein